MHAKGVVRERGVVSMGVYGRQGSSRGMHLMGAE